MQSFEEELVCHMRAIVIRRDLERVQTGHDDTQILHVDVRDIGNGFGDSRTDRRGPAMLGCDLGHGLFHLEICARAVVNLSYVNVSVYMSS